MTSTYRPSLDETDGTPAAKEQGRDAVRARRNHLIGHWAGRLLGLDGADLGTYAADLHEADHAVAGDDDILAKLKKDFAAQSIALDDREIARVLRDRHGQALRETSCTE